jgi:hypothetical protein
MSIVFQDNIKIPMHKIYKQSVLEIVILSMRHIVKSYSTISATGL